MEKKICEDCLKNEQVLQRRLWRTLLIVHDRLSTNTLHHKEDGEDDIDYQRLYWSREEIEELCTDYPWLRSFSTGLFTPFKLDCKNGCVID